MRRLLFIVLVALLAALPCPSQASTYVVKSCSSSTALRGDAWTAFGGAGSLTMFGDSCASAAPDTDGEVSFSRSRWFRPTLTSGLPNSPGGRVGGFEFRAPANARLTRLSYVRRLQSIDTVWSVRLRTDAGTGLGDDCVTTVQDQCPDIHGGSYAVETLPADTHAVEVAVFCGQSTCAYGSGPVYDFAIAIYSSEVTVEENTPPTASLTAPRYGNADTTLT
ncbi:MAG: hypothetical protein PGN13_03175, partial [Patulibacter minatonensis]